MMLLDTLRSEKPSSRTVSVWQPENTRITEFVDIPPSWNRADQQMTFKQLLQLDAIDVCQIDSCRTGGVQEILSILLMAAKKGVIVCPHSGGVVR